MSVKLIRFAGSIPNSDRSGIAGQISRAATSVLCNIAEGWGRGPGQANINFLRVSRGSTCELECLVDLAYELGHASNEQRVALQAEIANVRRLINRYMKSLEQSLAKETRHPYGVNHLKELPESFELPNQLNRH